jgi:hypothetical protein
LVLTNNNIPALWPQRRRHRLCQGIHAFEQFRPSFLPKEELFVSSEETGLGEQPGGAGETGGVAEHRRAANDDRRANGQDRDTAWKEQSPVSNDATNPLGSLVFSHQFSRLMSV